MPGYGLCLAMAYALYLDSDLVALALRLFAKINYACSMSMTVPVLMDGYLLS